MDSTTKILVVEDEAIVARDIERQLRKAGYDVPAVVASAEAAIEQVSQTCPDLVLMDIRLQGPIDGIEAAREIREHFKLPVIFLTAHADDETLARAKLTQPFGYIIKPIGHSNLTSSIEMALYKHRVERQLEEQRALLNTILQTIPEAVIVADVAGNVRFMNSAAEKLTGWTPAAFSGQQLASVVALQNTSSRNAASDLLALALRDRRTVRIPRGTRLRTRAGPWIEVDGHIAISEAADMPAGLMITLYDSTARHREEQQIRQEQTMLAVGCLAKDVANDYYSLLDLMSDCAQELVEELDEVSPLRETAAVVQRAAGTASQMTRQLLELGSNQALRPEPVDINQTFAKSLPFLQRLCGSSVELEMKLSPGVGNVFSHPSHIEQLALNLVLHSKDQLTGSGKIVIRTSAIGNQVPDAVPRARVRVSVRTEQFAEDRADASPAGQFTLENPALNLTIVNALVTAAEGSVRISDESDYVSVTEVILPSANANAHSAAARQAHRRSTVMTVGLDLKLALQVHERLEENSFFVLQSASAQEALLVSELYEGAIDLVIADDVQVSPRAQHQLYDVISSRRPKTAFLCLSSHAGTGAAREFEVLRKPFPPTELIDKALEMIAPDARATGA